MEKDYLLSLNSIDFPNLPFTILALISFVALIILIIFSLVRFFGNETRKNIYIKNKDLLPHLIIIGIYLTVLIGNLIYFIYICVKLNYNNKCTDLRKIKSDNNIINYIEEACKRITKNNWFIITGLILFFFSFIFFIIGWFFEQLYESYLKIKGRKLDLQSIYMEKKI